MPNAIYNSILVFTISGPAMFFNSQNKLFEPGEGIPVKLGTA